MQEKTDLLHVEKGKSILNVLTEEYSAFSAVCGGTGRCGKCKIRVLEGTLPVTNSDRFHFSEEELAAGMRLACRAFPAEPMKVVLMFDREDEFVVVANMQERPAPIPEGKFGIAIDIGTTTIAMQLVSLDTRKIVCAYTALNRQRRFGADVIARIAAASQGHGDELRCSIREDLGQGIRSLIQEAGIPAETITELAISGNTTMIHLLMGYDCNRIGAYPFTPVNIGTIESNYNAIFGNAFLNARVRILPGISVFVGGDIVAGLYEKDADLGEDSFLLIDFGTNGEVALGSKGRILVTSTAAGPAFEGGNICSGVGSIPGAIVGVDIARGKTMVKTIADKAPVGICGTGVIEAIAELLRTGQMDETGCLKDAYFEDGYLLAHAADGMEIKITQRDIREVQLAKAAVRAGLETLFLRYGMTKEAVSRVYLAGGFGFHLNCHKAVQIGLLPQELEDKVEIIGNSALSGTVKYLLEKDGCNRTIRIVEDAEEISLSTDKDFNRLYMEHMSF